MFLPTVAEAMLLAAEAALLHAEAALLDAEAVPLQSRRFQGKSRATPYPFLGEGMALALLCAFCYFLSTKVK